MLLNLSFQEIMLNSHHYVFWKDKNFVYLSCNQNFAELAGFNSPEKVIGKTDVDLWELNIFEAEIFRQGDINTIQGVSVIDARESITHPDGTNWMMLANKRLLRN